MTVKKILSFSLALFGLVALHTAQAQATAPKPDSVLLSERTEGDYRVSRYQVNEPLQAAYEIHYRINEALLQQSLGENGAELDSLKQLVGHLRDTLNALERVHITGYASPDGPALLNNALAKRRAESMQAYLMKQLGMSSRDVVALDSKIVSWDVVRAAVAGSTIPKRDAVLAILDSDTTPMEKQAALKSHPEVWRYLAAQILPPLRYAAVDLCYKQGRIVEKRTRIAAPKPAPKPKPTPTVKPTPAPVAKATDSPCRTDPDCAELLETETLGIIVAMPGTEVDF